MTEPTPRPVTARWVKVLLALSLALNLAILGVVGGAFLRDGPRQRDMPGDLSFGAFNEALSREDRRELRRAFMDRADEFRSGRVAAKAEFAALLTALRAEPFDPAALQAALQDIESRNAGRLAIGRELVEGRIVALTAEERLAFADRLEAALSRGRQRSGD